MTLLLKFRSQFFNAHESLKLPSYIYFLLPAELIGMSAYAQFIQMYFQTHSVFAMKLTYSFS